MHILSPHLIADPQWLLVLRPQSMAVGPESAIARLADAAVHRIPLDAAWSLHHIVSSAAT